MNKKQSNKFNSYLSIKGVLDKYRKMYGSFPMLDQTVGEFFDLLDQIKVVAAQTEMDTTGETRAMVLAKYKLVSLASSLAASGMVYAFDRSDPELKSALDYAYYKIRYVRDAEALQIAGTIETEQLKHQANLAVYLVSDKDLADQHQHIENFKEAMKIKEGGTIIVLSLPSRARMVG